MQGNASGQNNLGWMLTNGLGLPRDDEAALHQFRLAARKGNAFAMDNLGWMAEEGRGMAVDLAEALKWYRLAEAHGNAPARNHLALLSARGKGVPRDDVAAVNGFRTAAAQGLAPARHNLGYMVAKGLGTGALPDRAAGVALQGMAREVGPPNPEDLPALDLSALTADERTRSTQLLADFKRTPNVLAALDAELAAVNAAVPLLPVDATAASPLNGTDGGAVAAPSAVQR
jgi:hypothetical protein